MGLFGGGNSKTTNTSTVNDNDKNYNLQGVTGQNVIAGENNTVTNSVSTTVTDHGAVKSGIEAAKESLSKMVDFGGEAFGFGGDALALVEKSGEMISKAASENVESLKSSMVTAMQMQSEGSAAAQDNMAKLATIAATGNEIDKSAVAKYVIGGLITVSAIGLIMRGIAK